MFEMSKFIYELDSFKKDLKAISLLVLHCSKNHSPE
jgi:hypothetical protein